MTTLLRVRQMAGATFLALVAASAPLSAQPDPTPELVERSGLWTFTGNCLDCLDRYNLDNPDNTLTEYLVSATFTASTFWGDDGDVFGQISSFRYAPTNLVPGGVNIDDVTTDFYYARFASTGDQLTSVEFYWDGGFFRLGPQPRRLSPDYELSAGEWQLCLSDESVCRPPLISDYGNRGVMTFASVPVPEPTSFALTSLGLGFVGVVRLRRPRSRAA